MTTTAPGSTTPTSPEPSRRQRTAERERLRRKHIRRRIVVGVIGIFVVVVGFSWVRAITKAGQESFAARNAEWMRDHHLGFIVDKFEQVQVANDQPKDGGTPSKALTRSDAVPTTQPSRKAAAVVAVPPPPAMRTSAAQPFAGEGVWTPAGPLTKDGHYGVYTTRVRPNARKSSLVVFVARIDPKHSQVKIIPGTELPGGTWSHAPQITAAECPTAILASNGGFRFDQSQGGWYSDGRVSPNFALANGAASLVTYKDGTVTVGQWGRDISEKDLPRVQTVRQNLGLMVDGGAVVGNIDDGPKWGAKLRNSLFIWRSGYGITADGNLIYIGGPGLTPRDLAERFVDAGAVRAMQGDINPEWVAANLISSDASGCHGTKGLDATPATGGQQSGPNRYLSVDTRDFVAVLAKPAS